MLACQDLQKNSHSWKCATTMWRVIPLEMHFFGYSNNQREATLLQNVK
jgi:hypothetical protein